MNTSPLAVITTGTGFFQPGFKAQIVAGGERTVYLGPPGHEEKTTVAEFTLLFPDGSRREFCQYGRDFVFARLEETASTTTSTHPHHEKSTTPPTPA